MARRPKTPTVDQLIIKLGVGPTAVAEQAGITRATLQTYRRGARTPQVAQLVRLAKVLKVSPEALLASIRASHDAAL